MVTLIIGTGEALFRRWMRVNFKIKRWEVEFLRTSFEKFTWNILGYVKLKRKISWRVYII